MDSNKARRSLAGLLAVMAWAGGDVRAETWTFETGAGFVPGQSDTRMTMLIGPPSSPFLQAFGAVDFSAASAGPSPLVIDPPNPNFPVPGVPYSHPVFGTFPIPLCSTSANYIACDGPDDPYLNGDNPSNNAGGHTALYCIEFELTEPIECGKLTFTGLGDNGFGYDPSGTITGLPPGLGAYNEGVWLNGVPLAGTVFARLPSDGFFNPEPDDDPLDTQVGVKVERDVTTLLQVGTNRLYVYSCDLLTHSAALFCATVETNVPLGLGTAPAFVTPSVCGELLYAPANVPYTFQVVADDVDAGDVVTLSLTSPLPPGAVIDDSAAVGNPAVITIVYTPPHTQVTPEVFTFAAEDNTCERTECQLAVAPTECFIIAGTAATSNPSAVDPLHVVPSALVPVASSPLSVMFPTNPSFLGLELYTQVVMYSPYEDAFEGDPLKVSNGLHTVVGTGSTPYGAGSGLFHAADSVAMPGQLFKLSFGVE